MQILSRELPKTHDLYMAGDIHNGTVFQHEDGVNQLIEAVGSKHSNRLILMGDLAEAITIDDKRYSRSSENVKIPTPVLQYKDLVKRFKPIAKQIVVANDGNHDLKIANRYGNCVKDIFCQELNVPHGTYTSKISITDSKGKLMYKVFASHGFGSISSSLTDPAKKEAGMLASLRNRLMYHSSDCAISVMGHTHKLLIRRPASELYLYDDGQDKIKHGYTAHPQVGEYIPPDSRWYVNSGCFYKLYVNGITGYAEMKGYTPNELGYAVAQIDNGKIMDIKKVILD